MAESRWSRSGKPAVIAAALAALLAIIIARTPLPESDLSLAQAMLPGWVLPILRSTVERVFDPEIYKHLEVWLKNSLLPSTVALLSFGLFLRLSKRARPGWERLWPSWPAVLDGRLCDSSVGSIHPLATGQPFVGRAGEMERLQAFIHDPRPGLRYIAISGRMGLGKTRLALEALKAARQSRRLPWPQWDAGLLERDVTERLLRLARFRRPTVILIDDFSKWEAGWDLLAALAAPGEKQRIRVILTDQAAIPEPPLSVGESLGARLRDLRAPTVTLAGLDPASQAELASQSGPIDPDNLEKADGRPLLLKLGNDPAGEIARRGAELLSRAAQLFPTDGEALLVLAAMAGPIAVGRDGGRLSNGPVDLARPRNLYALSILFEGESRSLLLGAIPHLALGLLGRQITLQWLGSQQSPQALLRQALAANPLAFRQNIAAYWREGPERQRASELLQGGGASEALGAVRSLILLHHARPRMWFDEDITRATLLTEGLAAAGTAAMARALLADIDDLLGGWPVSLEVARVEAAACSAAAISFGKAGDFAGVSAALARSEALREAFPSDLPIAIKGASAATSASESYGDAGRLEDQAAMPDRVRVYRESFPDNPDLARLHALTIVRRVRCIASSGTWEGMPKMLAELDSLCLAFHDSTEIHSLALVAYAAAAEPYGAAGQWERLAAVLMRLDDISARVSPDPELDFLHAGGLTAAARWYGPAAGRYSEVSVILDRMAKIQATRPRDPRIAVFSSIACAFSCDGSWHSIATILSRLQPLHDAFPDNASIAQQKATAHAEAAAHFRKSGRWVELAAQLAEIQKLCSCFPDNAELARVNASAAANASLAYGVSKRWTDQQAVVDRLGNLRRLFPDDPEIAFSHLIGIHNQVTFAGAAAGQSYDAALARTTMAEISFSWPNDPNIQEMLMLRHRDLAFLEQKKNGFPYARLLTPQQQFALLP